MGIRNVMAKSRPEDILQNLHFSDNTKDDKSGKGYNVRSLIKHFNQNFRKSILNDDSQSIDKHISKYKQNNMSKFNLIKWGFKFDIVVWWNRIPLPVWLLLGKKRKRRRISVTRCCFENDWIPSKYSLFSLYYNFFISI